MGIRKVLGASVNGLVRMLTSEFTRLILLANIIAWPLAYFFMDKWLENFVYRSEISVWMFIFAAGFALGLALITVGIQSFRAASTQPVKVFRYE